MSVHINILDLDYRHSISITDTFIIKIGLKKHIKGTVLGSIITCNLDYVIITKNKYL